MTKMEGIKLKCPFCDEIWTYTKDKIYATCPSCMRKVYSERNIFIENDTENTEKTTDGGV